MLLQIQEDRSCGSFRGTAYQRESRPGTRLGQDRAICSDLRYVLGLVRRNQLEALGKNQLPQALQSGKRTACSLRNRDS